MYPTFYLFGNKLFANLRASICQTIPPFLSNNSGGKFVQNVNFRLHFVLFAVFYVILRRAKPLLKRDVPFKTQERDVYIIATASLEAELSFVYKRIRGK